ncbi:hypothetical protein [Candidatus Similichlamydia epinepheli]|uniref:hypothetical protein n=1 Tax=Candidatus Similichlamydia epinepheli TaxID=1903953 RepID=UPI000D3CB9D8|nr:hypothetical protein [Candidatus Similichlamydia epinepheli]
MSKTPNDQFQIFLQRFRPKLEPFWQKLMSSVLKRSPNSLQTWIQDFLQLQLGNTFTLEHGFTDNKYFFWIDNRYTNHRKHPVCLYLPMIKDADSERRLQEMNFFWGILLSLKGIQWTKDPSFCRVSWIMEWQAKSDSCCSSLLLQKLSLKGRAGYGLVLDGSFNKKDETWASSFLNQADPECFFNSSTAATQAFRNLGYQMVGCHHEPCLSFTQWQDKPSLSIAERLGSFLIRMLSGLD